MFGYLIVAKPKDGAARRLGDAALPPRDRVPLLARGRRRARLLPHTQDHRARARPLRRGRRGLEGQLRRRGAARPRRRRDRPPRRPLPRDDRPARRGGGARAQLPDVRLARAADAADGDPRPRRRAARGRRQRPGVDRRLARDRRRGGGAARTARRRRARPRQARRPPVHRPDRGGRHGPGAGARLLDVLRGGPAAWDRVHVRGGVGAGDRVGRRPRAPDHLQPALERLPLDAGRRPDRPGAADRERNGHGRRRRHRPGDHGRRARADLPAVLVDRRARHGTRACRSRASWRWRSAAGSSCRPRWARGAASGSSCRTAASSAL